MLRENDLSEYHAFINLIDTRISGEEWTEAISRNEHVRQITFHFFNERGRNFDVLLRAISTRDILEDVTLFPIRVEFNSRTRNYPELLTSFLQSIQLNPAIQTVRLMSTEVSGTELARFLDAATSVTKFEISRCKMKASERKQGMIDLAAAIQRNTNIRNLALKDLEDIYLCPILSSLASNPHVNELEIEMSANQASESVKRLLESTSTIELFKLSGLVEDDFHPITLAFRPIAQGLINSESVTDISLDHCNFPDEESTTLLKRFLQSKSNEFPSCACLLC
jgi:hypothetical protein